MSIDYKFGRADTPQHYDLIAQTAANRPDGYDASYHRDWALGRLLTRMENGFAIPCPVFYNDELAAMAVGYREPSTSVAQLPGLEIKLLRTFDKYRGRGLATIAVKTLVASAVEEMDVAPGSPIRLHLDTRNPDTALIFSAMGFQQVAEAELYGHRDPEAPENLDLLMEKIAIAPQRL